MNSNIIGILLVMFAISVVVGMIVAEIVLGDDYHNDDNNKNR